MSREISRLERKIREANNQVSKVNSAISSINAAIESNNVLLKCCTAYFKVNDVVFTKDEISNISSCLNDSLNSAYRILSDIQNQIGDWRREIWRLEREEEDDEDDD